MSITINVLNRSQALHFQQQQIPVYWQDKKARIAQISAVGFPPTKVLIVDYECGSVLANQDGVQTRLYEWVKLDEIGVAEDLLHLTCAKDLHL